jgi:NADPH-dependent curcumin reductase CurA
MPPPINRQITLASRPHGDPGLEHFKLVETPIPAPGPGEMLLKTQWLSLDPYMRGRMSDAKSYAKPVEVGGVMVGGTVSRVVASNIARFRAGDIVLAYGGWQDYAISNG